MRISKHGILPFALLVVALATTATLSLWWESVYCHFVLDPRLVGRWTLGRYRGNPTDYWLSLEFERLGNVTGTWEPPANALDFYSWSEMEQPPPRRLVGEYRIVDRALVFAWSDGGSHAIPYRINGDNLALQLTDTQAYFMIRDGRPPQR